MSWNRVTGDDIKLSADEEELLLKMQDIGVEDVIKGSINVTDILLFLDFCDYDDICDIIDKYVCIDNVAIVRILIRRGYKITRAVHWCNRINDTKLLEEIIDECELPQLAYIAAFGECVRIRRLDLIQKLLMRDNFTIGCVAWMAEICRLHKEYGRADYEQQTL